MKYNITLMYSDKDNMYGVFRLSDYVITNKGWKINID